MDFKTGQDDGLQTGADFRDYKSGQEGLQIGAALGITKLAKGLQIGAGITNRGKGITNWGRDYKSGQEGLQIGAGITNRGKDYKSVQYKSCIINSNFMIKT